MSGAAGLSAAKRRRAGGAPTNQTEQRRTQVVPQSQNRRYSQSAYNQYRQQAINPVQTNRENITPGERVNFSILLKDLNNRVKKIEENLDIKKQVIPEENNVKDETYNLLLSEISNIKTLIMNLQSAYVVQNKKMEEYCQCQENKLNEQDEDLVKENLEFKEKTKSSVEKNNDENKKENQTLKISEKKLNKDLAKEVSKEVNKEITKEKVVKKKEKENENKKKEEEKNELGA